MPDCSAIELTVSEPLTERLAVIVGERDWTFTTNEEKYQVYEDDDAAWGLGSIDGICAALRDAGIGYRAVDYGHYTWQAYEVGWAPGMMDEALRYVDGGEAGAAMPLLEEHRAKRFIQTAATHVELVRLLERFYGDDPRGWELPQKVEVAKT